MLRLVRHILLAFAALSLANAASPVLAAPAPVVVASILPLHSLLANVMAGVGSPLLLMRPGSSPHNYVMRPSEASMLAHADLVFWLGESGERILLKPLSLPTDTARRMVALLDQPSIHLLALRPVGPWSGPAKPAPDRHSYLTDSHIWLDPEIAREIVLIMVAELSRVDPSHAAAYEANGHRTTLRLDALDDTLRHRLAPVKQVPYMVYHEAFQYFEQRYDLNNLGSVSDNSDIQPGARLIEALKETIAKKHVHCLFVEPQFSPSLVRVLAEGSRLRIGTVDPEGAGLTPGPDAYFEMMTRLGNSLASCLAAR